MNTDPAVLGWALGLGGGAVIGIAGGLLGTYASIRATESAAERGFVVRASVALWIVVTVFLALMMVLPDPYRHMLWLPYAIGLPLAIRSWNRTQAGIRREQAGSHPAPPR